MMVKNWQEISKEQVRRFTIAYTCPVCDKYCRREYFCDNGLLGMRLVLKIFLVGQ